MIISVMSMPVFQFLKIFKNNKTLSLNKLMTSIGFVIGISVLCKEIKEKKKNKIINLSIKDVKGC